MPHLQARSGQAARRIHALRERPGNDILLRLHAQCREGSAGDARPGSFDLPATAKDEAWSMRKVTPPDEARQAHADPVKTPTA